MRQLMDENRFWGEGIFLEGDVIDRLQDVQDKSVDLIISSPPYNIGKVYERHDSRTHDQYIQWQTQIIEILDKKLKNTGSICWQVGSHVRSGEVFPIDIYVYPIFKNLGYSLKNRIIWKFNFGLHSDKRFSGRYETVLWFVKSDDYVFNLDPVRVPQRYPGKRHSSSKSNKAGQLSGNPKGKNPTDYWEFSAERDFLENPIWDIPNVKANHPEKTVHPCQFPIELAERCVLALSPKGGVVLDPFVGTGASVIAASKNGRMGIGIDRFREYLDIAEHRLNDLKAGALRYRPLGKPVYTPSKNEKVSIVPFEWREQKNESDT